MRVIAVMSRACANQSSSISLFLSASKVIHVRLGIDSFWPVISVHKDEINHQRVYRTS